jgi:hypothetical protein
MFESTPSTLKTGGWKHFWGAETALIPDGMEILNQTTGIILPDTRKILLSHNT